MRKLVTYTSLVVIFSLIAAFFYIQEIQYWTPTPLPKGFKPIAIGTKVDLNLFRSSEKKLIHFYNPNCPCSKFNTPSYKALLKQYRHDFDCYVVIQKAIKGLDNKEADFLKELNVKIVVDLDKRLANAYGVYSTPQIVLVDEMDQIYYRGNYNQARYCTNPQTNFAKIAIDSMLRGSEYLFPSSAFTAYGCSLNRKTY
ncbi:MAG: AhpC/TSA family protein [Bacteroidota bacterium]